MKFVEYKDVSKNRIRELSDHQVRIHQDWYSFPCAISAQQIVTNDQLKINASIECFEQLISKQSVDLIILGRSQTQIVFDLEWHKLMISMNQKGIGLEQMSHDAAARTFNVLMTEERPFWLILT